MCGRTIHLLLMLVTSLVSQCWSHNCSKGLRSGLPADHPLHSQILVLVSDKPPSVGVSIVILENLVWSIAFFLLYIVMWVSQLECNFFMLKLRKGTEKGTTLTHCTMLLLAAWSVVVDSNLMTSVLFCPWLSQQRDMLSCKPWLQICRKQPMTSRCWLSSWDAHFVACL